MPGPGLLRDKAAADESEPVVTALLDRYRERFSAAHRSGQLGTDDYPPEQAYRKSMLVMGETRVPAAPAARIRTRLGEVMDELNAAGAEDPGGVPVNVLVGFYSPAVPDGPSGPSMAAGPPGG